MGAHDPVNTNVRENVVLRRDVDGIAHLTLNRPKAYNALSEEVLAALIENLENIKANRSIRVVVISGNGPAFCAGHDLKQMRSKPSKEYYDNLFETCSKFMLSIIRLPQPVIARVHGMATAAGCQLVGTCDLAVASDNAKFGTSGINYGLFCSTPAVAVTRNVPRKKAAEMLFTGEFISAETAKEIGLVNRVVPEGSLDSEIHNIADAIIRKSAVAVETGKKMLYRQIEMGIDDAYKYSAEVMACNMMANDVSEGIDAFIEKRDPSWTHS